MASSSVGPASLFLGLALLLSLLGSGVARSFAPVEPTCKFLTMSKNVDALPNRNDSRSAPAGTHLIHTSKTVGVVEVGDGGLLTVRRQATESTHNTEIEEIWGPLPNTVAAAGHEAAVHMTELQLPTPAAGSGARTLVVSFESRSGNSLSLQLSLHTAHADALNVSLALPASPALVRHAFNTSLPRDVSEFMSFRFTNEDNFSISNIIVEVDTCAAQPNDCSASPCLNGGLCSFLDGKRVCACPPTATGELCADLITTIARADTPLRRDRRFCPTGYYHSAKKGSWWSGYTYHCSSCPPGYRCLHNIAYPCYAGYYQGSYGRTSCPSCPAGKYSNAAYSTYCHSCYGGKYSPQSASGCSACPAGTYSGWAYGSCPSCPGGKISSYAKSYCTACNYGQYKGSASACYNCPSRKYTSTSSNGYTGCYNCPAGSYCPGGKVSYGCPAGKYSPYYSYTCYNCPRDKISGSYAGSCRNCPSGQYTNRQVGRPTCSSYCNACAYGGKCTQTSYGYNCRCPLGRYGSKCHSTYNSCHSFSCAPYSGTVTSCSGASRHCSLAHGTRRSDLVMFENFDGLSALLQPDVKYSWWANVWTPTPPEGLTVDLGSTGAVNKGHPFSGWTFGYATWWNSRDSLSVGFPYEGTHGHNIIAVADSRLLTQYNYWAWGPIYAILETQAITIPSNTNQVRIWFDTKFHGNYWQCGYFEVSTNGHAFGTLGYFTGPSAYRNYAKTVTVPVGTTRVWFRWRVHNAQSSFLWGIDNIKVVADQRALCHSGWYGDVCEHNINDCAGNPCRNGGTCRDGINSYVCYCRTGFRGANCAENINDCRSDTCSYHGQCSDGINSFTCACHYGYSGTRCTTRNECLPNPCHNGATCHDDHNKARCVYAHGTCYVNTAGTQLSCSCHAGWTGARCNTNINECAPGPCKNSGTCTDLINGFTCACRPGWAGHTCTTNVNECAPRPCENGGTCRDGINSYTCSCPPSHYGTTCQIKEPCVPSPCHASATLCERNAAGLAKCVYTNGDCIIQANGSPQCSCDTGFTGTDCATNIDDCASNPCLNGATCHDGIMSFACVCLPQFAGITCACPRGMSGDKCDVSCVTAPVTSVVNTYSSSATNQVMRVSPTLDATVTFTHAKALTSGQTVTLVLHGKTSWTREPPVVLVLRGTTVACRMTYTHGRMACSSPLFRAGGSFIVRLAADVDPALVEIYDDSASWHFLRPVLEVEHHLEDQMDCPWDACTWSSWDMSACSMQACAASPVKSRWPVAKQAHTSPADTISCLLAKQSAPCYAGSCSSTTCSWSPWDPWGACSVACGGNGGFEMRVRQPQSSSALWCPGAATETRSCGNTACHPSDCAWSVWSSWSSVCTVSCGGGVHRRHRHVLSHARHGGQECAGDAAETRPCNTQGCPIDCVFSQWTDWSPCTASCGNAGETVRTRAPLNAHMYGGKPCTGSTQETVACNRIACPIDCVWTTWTAYDTCSVASCGGGTQKRSRTQSPAAAHGGRPCTGSATNSRACNEKPCTTPFDCVWSSWSDWECGAACNEAGTSTRTRTIVSPTQPGGLDCTGGNSETGTCQGDPCPVDCTLADWTTWSACSELCGGGSKQRQRGEAQSAAYGGAACSSTLARSESMVCNSVDCKHVLCSWEQWSAWGACSKTCDGGSQTRERKLITSSHTFVCETLDRETRSCGTGVCINTIACAKAVPDSDADRRCKGVVGGELFMELGAGVAALGVVNQVVESVEAQSALVSFLNSLLTVTYGDQRPQDILFTAITTPQPDSVVIYAQTQLSGRVLVKFVAEMLGMPLLTMVPFPDLSVFPTVEKFFSSMRPGPTAHPFTHHSTATAPANRRRDEFLKNSIDYSAMGVQDGTFGAGFLSMISPKAPVQELQLNNLFDLSVSGKVGKDGSCAALYWYLSLMGKFKLQRTATAMDNCPWTIAALIRYATGSKDIVGDEGFVPIPLATMGFKSFTIVLNNGRTNLALFGGGLSGGVGSRGRRDLHRASIFELEAEYYRTRDNTDVHEMQPRDAAQRGQSFVAWLLREREKLEAEHARVCGPMNPCSNNGTCHLHDTDEGIFVCECPLGFHGSRCASTIDHCASLPCTHNGTCDANADGFVCECPPAFAGDVCELLADTCASSPCANKGACFHSLWSPTGFVCECTSPWAGLFCDHVEPAVLAAAYTSGTEVALQTHANHMSRRALGDADSIKNFFTTFWKPSTFTIDLEFAFATRSDVTFEDSDGVLRLAYQGYMGCDIVIGWNNVGNLKASGRDLCTKSTAARTFFGGEYEYSPAVPFHFQFTASISFLFAGLQFALGIGREFIDDVNQIDQCEWYKAQRGITRRDIVDASAVRPLVLAHDLRLTRETIVAMDKDTFQVFQNLVCDSRNPFITCFDGTRDSAKRLAEDLPADALEREDLRLGRVRRNPDTGELEETGYEPDENVRVDESNDVTESEMLYDMDDDDIFDTDMDVDSNGLALSRGTRATDCNPGKQHDAGGSCVPCGAGKYNDVVNGACKRCPSGKRGKTGIRDGCDPCATGRFSSQAGLQTCVECTEGKYADVTGSKSCKSCSAGKMLNAKGATAASDCTPCGKGTYSSSGSSVCTQCRGGRFSDATSATGSSTCKACTSGRYSSTMGASECANECSKGKFSTSTGAKASTACKPCSAGKFSNLEGGSVCTPCTAGTHTATSGLSECANCAAGKISKATGQSVCSDCAAGHYQDGEGTSVCKKCAAGKAVAAKGSVAAASCVMCDFGFYSSSEGATECKVCAPEKYSAADRKTCKTCPAGKIRDENAPGDEKCSECGTNSYTPSPGEQCAECAPNKIAKADGTGCNACPSGHHRPKRGEVCLACPLGTFSKDDSKGCQTCPSGKYSDAAGATQCTDCAIGRFSSASSLTVCTACDEGKVATKTGLTTCSSCPSSKYTTNGQTCIECASPKKVVDGRCVDCSGNQFMDASLAPPACAACPANQVPAADGQSCEACDATSGKVKKDNRCVQCKANEKIVGTDCTPCPAGEKRSSADATICAVGCDNDLVAKTKSDGSVVCELVSKACKANERVVDNKCTACVAPLKMRKKDDPQTCTADGAEACPDGQDMAKDGSRCVTDPKLSKFAVQGDMRWFGYVEFPSMSIRSMAAAFGHNAEFVGRDAKCYGDFDGGNLIGCTCDWEHPNQVMREQTELGALCTVGHYANEGVCTKCKSPKVPDADRLKCIECDAKAGEFPAGDSSGCITCVRPQYRKAIACKTCSVAEGALNAAGTACEACVVPLKRAADGSACVRCPAGQALVSGKCTECTGTTAVNAAGTACVTCPSATTERLADGCKQKTATVSNCLEGDDKTCTRCQPGHKLESGKCLACPGDLVVSADGKKCISCPSGMKAAEDHQRCLIKECAADAGNARTADGECVACTGDKAVQGDKCVKCASPMFPLADHSACDRCPNGKYRDTTLQACLSCASGMAVNVAGTGCMSCTGKTKVAKDQRGCESNTGECDLPQCSRCSLDGTTCEMCMTGAILNTPKTACTPCKKGEAVNSDRTACVACPAGTIVSRGGDQCLPIKCTEGFFLSRVQGQCLTCDTRALNSYYDGCFDFECSAIGGSTVHASKVGCTCTGAAGEVIPDHFYCDTSKKQLLDCPRSMPASLDKTDFPPKCFKDAAKLCPNGSILKGRSCEKCGSGKTNNADKTACITTPTSRRGVGDDEAEAGALVRRADADIADGDTIKSKCSCIQHGRCRRFDVRLDATFQCIRCPSGSASNGHSCKYCPAGQYLTIDGLCRACTTLEKLESGWCVPHKGSVAPGIKPNYCVDPFRGYTAGRWAESKFLNGFLRILGSITFIAPTIKVYPGFGKSYTLVSLSVTVEWLSFTCPLELRLFQKDPNTRVGRRRGAGSTALDMFKSMAMTVEVSLKQIAKLIGVVTSAISGEDVTSIINKFVPRDVDIRIAFTYSGDEKDLLLNPNVRPKFDAYKYAKRIPKGFSVLLSISLPPLSSPDCGDICHFIKENLGDVFIMMYLGINPGDPTAGESPIVEFGASIGGFVLSRDDNNCPEVILEELGFFAVVSPDPTKVKLGFSAGLSLDIGRLIDGPPASGSCAPVNNLIFSLTISISTTQFTLDARMIGIWPNAFGLKHFFFGNARLMIGISPSSPVGLSAFGLAADVRYGAAGCSERVSGITKLVEKTGCIGGSLDFQVSTAEPLNNYFFGALYGMTLKEVFAATMSPDTFKDVCGVMPDDVLTSGFPRPPAGQDQGNPRLSFTTNPAGHQTPTRRIPFGFQFYGHVKILSIEAGADVVIMPPPSDPAVFKVKFWLKNAFDLGGIVALQRSCADNVNGPYFFANVVLSMSALAEGKSPIKELGVNISAAGSFLGMCTEIIVSMDMVRTRIEINDMPFLFVLSAFIDIEADYGSVADSRFMVNITVNDSRLRKILTSIRTELKSASEAFNKAMDQANDDCDQFFDDVGAAFEEAGKAIAEFATAAVQAIGAAFEAAAAAVVKFVTALVDGFKKAGTALIKGIEDFMRTGDFSKLGEAIGEAFKQVLAGVFKAFGAECPSYGPTCQAEMGKLNEKLKKYRDDTSKRVKQLDHYSARYMDEVKLGLAKVKEVSVATGATNGACDEVCQLKKLDEASEYVTAAAMHVRDFDAAREGISTSIRVHRGELRAQLPKSRRRSGDNSMLERIEEALSSTAILTRDIVVDRERKWAALADAVTDVVHDVMDCDESWDAEKAVCDEAMVRSSIGVVSDLIEYMDVNVTMTALGNGTRPSPHRILGDRVSYWRTLVRQAMYNKNPARVKQAQFADAREREQVPNRVTTRGAACVPFVFEAHHFTGCTTLGRGFEWCATSVMKQTGLVREWGECLSAFEYSELMLVALNNEPLQEVWFYKSLDAAAYANAASGITLSQATASDGSAATSWTPKAHKKGTLFVEVLHGRGMGSSADAYVRLLVDGTEVFVSTTKTDSATPAWNEKYQASSVSPGSVLTVEVWECDLASNCDNHQTTTGAMYGYTTVALKAVTSGIQGTVAVYRNAGHGSVDFVWGLTVSSTDYVPYPATGYTDAVRVSLANPLMMQAFAVKASASSRWKLLGRVASKCSVRPRWHVLHDDSDPLANRVPLGMVEPKLGDAPVVPMRAPEHPALNYVDAMRITVLRSQNGSSHTVVTEDVAHILELEFLRGDQPAGVQIHSVLGTNMTAIGSGDCKSALTDGKATSACEFATLTVRFAATTRVTGLRIHSTSSRPLTFTIEGQNDWTCGWNPMVSAEGSEDPTDDFTWTVREVNGDKVSVLAAVADGLRDAAWSGETATATLAGDNSALVMFELTPAVGRADRLVDAILTVQGGSTTVEVLSLDAQQAYEDWRTAEATKSGPAEASKGTVACSLDAKGACNLKSVVNAALVAKKRFLTVRLRSTGVASNTVKMREGGSATAPQLTLTLSTGQLGTRGFVEGGFEYLKAVASSTTHNQRVLSGSDVPNLFDRGITLMAWVRLLANEGTCSGTGVRTVLAASPAWQAMNTAVKEADTSPLVRANAAKTQNCEQTSFAVGAVALAVTCDGRVVVQMRQRYCEQLVKTLSSERTVVLRVPSQEGKLSWQHVAVVVRAEAATVEFFVDGVSSGEVVYDFSDSLTAIKLAATPARMYTTAALLYANPLSASLVAGRMVSTTPSTVGRIGGVCRASANVPLTYCPVGSTCTGEGYGKGQGRSDLLDERICAQVCPTNGDTRDERGYCKYGAGNAPNGHHCKLDVHCASQHCDVPHGKTDGKCAVNYGNTGCNSAIPCRGQSQSRATCVAGRCIEKCFIPAYESTKAQGKCMFQGSKDVLRGFPCASPFDCAPGATCKAVKLCNSDPSKELRCVEECVSPSIGYMHARAGVHLDARVASFAPSGCAGDTLHTGKCVYRGDSDVPAGMGCTYAAQCQTKATFVTLCKANVCVHECEHTGATVVGDKCSYVGAGDIPAGHACATAGQCLPLKGGGADCVNGVCVQSCRLPSIPVLASGACEFTGMGDLPHGAVCAEDTNCKARPEVNGKARCWLGLCEMLCPYSLKATPLGTACEYEGLEDVPLGMQCVEMHHCKSTVCQDRTCVEKCVWDDIPHQADGTCKYKGESDLPVGLTCQYDSECAAPRKGDASCIAGACAHQCRLQVPLLVVDRVPQCQYSGNADLPVGHECTADSQCQRRGGGSAACVAGVCEQTCYMANTPLNSLGECLYSGEWDVPPFGPCNVTRNCRQEISNAVFVCVANQCREQCLFDDIPVHPETGRCTLQGHADLPAGSSCNKDSQCVPRVRGIAKCTRGTCTPACAHPSIKLRKDGSCDYLGVSDIPAGDGCYTSSQCRPATRGTAECVANVCVLACFETFLQLDSAGVCPFSARGDLPIGSQCNPAELGQCLKGTRGADETLVDRCVPNSVGAHDVCAPPPQYAMKSQVYAAAVEYDAGVQSRWTLTSRGEAFVPRSVELENTVWQATSATSIVMQFVKPTTMPPAADTRFVLFVTCVDCAPDQIVGEALGNAPLLDASTTTVGAAWSWYESAVELRHTTPTPSIRCEEAGYTTSDRQFVQLQCTATAVVAASSKAGLVTLALWSTRGSVTLYGMASPDPSDMPMLYGGSVASASSEFPDMLQGSHLAAVTRRDAEMDDEVWENDMEFDNGRDEEESTGHFQAAPKRRVALPGTPAVDAWEAEWAREADLAEQRYQEVAAMQRPEEMNDEVEEEEEEMMWTNEMLSEHRRRSAENGRGNALHAPVMPPSFEEEDRQLLAHMATLTESDRALVAAHDDEKWLLEDGEWKYECASPNDPRNRTIDGRCWWAKGEVPAGIACLQDRDCASGSCVWADRMWDATGRCAKGVGTHEEVEVWRRGTFEYGTSVFDDDDKVVSSYVDVDDHAYIPRTQMALHREARFFLCDAAVGLARGVVNLGFMAIDGLISLFMKAFQLNNLNVFLELFPGKLQGTLSVALDAVVFGIPLKFDLTIDLGSLAKTIVNLLIRLGRSICDGLEMGDICNGIIESL